MITNPKHISNVKVIDKVLRQNQRNKVYVLQNVEIDHEACNRWIWRIISRVTDSLDHRILRILAIPSVPESFQDIV